jgi:hypothetical protein
VEYLDADALDRLDARAFRRRRPYPWANPEGLLRREGFEKLLASPPEVSRFEAHFGVPRAHGQTPHDRYALDYTPELDVPAPWHAFVAELRGPVYRRFLRRMLGTGAFRLVFHWHYAPRGASISPHCDNRRKLASHIFYLNDDAEWDPDWGGQTLVLDDGGRMSRRSAPGFDAFDAVHASASTGNRSLLFACGPHSWHGMREIRCPEGRMRRVFIAVVLRDPLWERLRRRLAGRLPGRGRRQGPAPAPG